MERKKNQITVSIWWQTNSQAMLTGAGHLFFFLLFLISLSSNLNTFIKSLTEWEIEVQKYELNKLRRTLAEFVLIKEDINLNNLWVQFK